jgi:hypothetical protein
VGIAGMEDTYNKHAILMEDHTKESNELDFLKFNTSQFNRDMYAHQKAQEINNKKINELQNSQNDYVDTQSLDYQFSRLGI